MPKKKSARKASKKKADKASKKKKAAPKKRAARKAAPKRRAAKPAAKRPVAGAIEVFEVEVIGGGEPVIADEGEIVDAEGDEEFPHDEGGSE